jgi:hypothetical protein
LKLKGFQYPMTLDLYMEYYHIKLSPFSKHLCIIVMPYGKYNSSIYLWVYAIVLIFFKDHMPCPRSFQILNT